MKSKNISYYLNKDKNIFGNCNINCKTCDGPDNNNCLTCKNDKW